MQEIAPVYGAIRGALLPGGAFRMADGIRGATEQLHRTHMQRWEAFWREPGNLSAEEIAEVQQHVEAHDHYVALREHFRLLEEAGFVAPDCVWRDGLFGVLTAAAGTQRFGALPGAG